MILSIDFGGAVAKVLVLHPPSAKGGSGADKEEKFHVVEVPLGFRTRPRMTVPDALRYVIKQAIGDPARQRARSQARSGGQKPEAVYVSGEIASVELKEILTEPALDPVEALEKLELPIVVVGAGITCVGGHSVRGEDVEEYAEEIANWLPFEVKISEIQNYFANKKIYPQVVPTTEREIMLEQAAARVRIKAVLNPRPTSPASELAGGRAKPSTPNPDYVIASGGVFSKAPSPSGTIQMLLDSLQPKNLLKIYLDKKQILPVLATLAVYEEERVQKILNQDPFDFLGATFSVSEAVSLKIDVGLKQVQELELDLGELAVFPLDEGKTAQVHFETKSEKGEFKADGGPAGLVIDARGRPFQPPKGAGERQRILTEWKEQICFAPLFKK